MRLIVVILALFALVPLAAAQDTTPPPDIEVETVPVVPGDPDATPVPTGGFDVDPALIPQATETELLRNFDLPLYLSGVGATPIERNVNIRFGPGVDYRVIGVLRYGRSIDVVGTNGYDQSRSCVGVNFEDTLDMWITVQWNDQRGWIARCTVTITGDMSKLLVHPAP